MTNIQSTMHYALIMYHMDYDPKDPFEKKTYKVTKTNLRNYYDIGIADGGSIEFLITMTYVKLQEVIDKIPNPGWTGVCKFKDLLMCLSGGAKSDAEDLIEKEYNMVPLKDAAGGFGEFKKKLITEISDHPFSGDRIQTYLSTRVKYMRLKKEDGQMEDPVKVLARLRRIRK